MKSRTMILMGVAVVCGLVASYLTSRMLANQGSGEEEKVQVVVAKDRVPAGTLIKDPAKYFMLKDFTKGSEPKKAFTSLEQLKDKKLKNSIGSEAHVTPDDIAKKEDEGLAGDIPPGMRAVAIRVGIDTTVAGFVLPRSHVDIVSTTHEGGTVSQILLQDMLVLAVDQSPAREDGRTVMPAATVTIQATPEEAEVLTLAQSKGELRLLLRSDGDHEKVSTAPKRSVDLAKGAGLSGSSGSPEDTTGSSGPQIAPKAIPDAPPPPIAEKPAPAPEKPTVIVEKAPEKNGSHTVLILNGSQTTRH